MNLVTLCSTKVHRGCDPEVGDVVGRPGDEVVHPHDLVALGQEPVGEMRTEEAGGAGDEDSHGRRRPMP